MEYRLATPPPPRGYSTSMVPTPCVRLRRCEQLAIRGVFVDHPAGEGLYMLLYVVDHTPTGRRVYGPHDQSACVRFAKALASTPFDWSGDMESLQGQDLAAFVAWARAEAAKKRSATWARWRGEGA